MHRVVAILNQKGGVGKTTVTLGLAAAAATAHRKVLVIDLDPQASATWALGVDDPARTVSELFGKKPPPIADLIVPSTWSSSIDVVAGSVDLQRSERTGGPKFRSALRPVVDRYDAVLLDCPPSLGGITASALTAARHAIVVVEPSALGLRGIGGLAGLIESVWDDANPDLELSGVIVNRVPAISAEAARRIEELGRIVGSKTVWRPMVPQRVVLNQAIGERRSVHSFGARSADSTAAFDALWRKLQRTIRNSATPRS